MSSSKKQSLIVIGLALVIIAGIVVYFSLSQPKLLNSSTETQSTFEEAEEQAETQTEATYSDDETEAQSETAISVEFPLNLNTCTAEELCAINGIGTVTASAIIEYREALGGYTSVEQIKEIKGIGDATYEKAAPYLCV